MQIVEGIVRDAHRYIRERGFALGVRFYLAAVAVFAAFFVVLGRDQYVPAIAVAGVVALLGLITHVWWLLTKLKE
jgi:hypothetical protein